VIQLRNKRNDSEKWIGKRIEFSKLEEPLNVRRPAGKLREKFLRGNSFALFTAKFL